LKIQPKKWTEFQHYRDRDPKWIKLHLKLLDDVVFQRLPLASRALAPMLWLMAAEHDGGVIDLDGEDIAFRLRWDEKEFTDALGPLIGKGFFEVVQFASKPLAEPEQSASPETERETEREAEPRARAASKALAAPDSAGSRGAAALEALKLSEARIPGGDETPAAILASVLKANGLRGNAFHPAVVEWARDRISVDRLKDAIAKARQRPGKEKGVFGPEYLTPILYDETKPAAQVHAEKASDASRKSIEKAQRIIAEQRSRDVAPMPEHLRPKPLAH